MVFFELFSNAPDIVRVPAGKALFHEGEGGCCMFVLTIGSAEVYVKNRRVELLVPGNMVGELALVTRGPRTATVLALEDSEFVSIDEDRFNYLVQHTPFFALNVMRLLAERLTAASSALPAVEDV